MKALESHAFNTRTRARVEANMARFSDRRQPAAELRRAAVAVTVFDHGGEAAIILTMRAARLRNHGSQWALPGGRIDPGETVTQAALRELREEINLALDESQVVGLLDDYVTRSGYLITPVVVWAEVDFDQLQANPDEVDSIHAMGFGELMRTDSPRLESIPQSDRQVLSMHYGSGWIYAPTAAILYQFRQVVIRGEATRVRHYEQPVFAWK